MINDANTKGRMVRNGDGSEIRNYINVKDVAKYCIVALQKKYENKNIMMLGKERKSIKQVLNLIKSKLNKKIKIGYNGERDFAHYKTSPFTFKKRKVENIDLELLIIRFEHERMTLRVPLSKATESGLRTLSSKVQMEEAIITLKGKAKVKKTMWSRRAQEYDTKINSGSLVLIAEVVRDLYRKDDQGEQSYSERQMYQAALERLASEFAAVDETDKDSAVLKLEKIIDDSSEEAA